MKLPLPMHPWYGGYSTDTKMGPRYSFAYGRAVDFRKSPSALTVLPGMAKDSGSTVTDLVTAGVRVANGDQYFLGDTGNFYKRTAAGTWSLISNLGSSGHGMAYRPDTDAIYLTKSTEVARYAPISNSPSLSSSKYAASLDQSLTGGASTFNLATSISEAATAKQSFTPTAEPLYSVKLYVTAKGTSADWTVTVHDDANNVVATSTVTNANLTNGALNEFVFSTPGRMLVKPNARTYHIHVTATNTTGTPQARVTTLNDFETADFQEYASRLVTSNNGMHPATVFAQYVCIGNERYVTAWEPLSDTPSNTEWLRHRITFPPGYEVTSMAVQDEFLAIACERISSTSETIGSGKIFWWDGTATTYNFFVDVPQGSPYSLFSSENTLYFVAGGALYAIPGVNSKPVKVRQFPNTDQEFTGYDKFSILYPQMMAVRNGILLSGFPSTTQNRNIEHGIYSLGQRDKDYPVSFGFSYPISTGTLTNTGSNNLKIGMVAAFDPKLYVSWRDGSSYGVDVVDQSSNPAAISTLSTLIFDGGRADKEKNAIKRTITFTALPTGCTITPKYKIDRASNWTSGTAATAGATSVDLDINTRFKEIQFAMDIVCTTTSPTITSDTFIYDNLKDEAD